MKLRYGYAVVSFCPDLTSPNVGSIPIAGLLVGEAGEHLVAAVAWLKLGEEVFRDDPILGAVMKDVPKLLRDHVDEAWQTVRRDRGTAEDLLFSLQNALRNSIHVSQVAPFVEQDVDVGDNMGLVSNLLIHELNQRLREAIDSIIVPAQKASPPVLRPTRISTLPAKASPLRFPEVQFWELERRSQPPFRAAHPAG